MVNRTSRADPLLIAEVILALAGFALGIYVYLIPAESPDQAAPWWSALLLAILFFAVVILETLRRQSRARRMLHGALDEDLDEPIDRNEELPT